MKVITSAALIAAIAILGPQAGAQIKDPPAYRPVAESGDERIPLLSEASATRLSALGTLVPAGLGLILAATKHGHDREYIDWNGYSVTYHDDPDQTAPAFLISSGLIVGPSLGYFYAGRPGRAFAGMGIRTAIGFGALIGAFATCGWGCGRGDGSYNAAWGIVAVGGAVVVGSAIHDISSVGNAVRAQNQKHQKPKLSVVPEYFPGHKAIGLRAKITFN